MFINAKTGIKMWEYETKQRKQVVHAITLALCQWHSVQTVDGISFTHCKNAMANKRTYAIAQKPQK